MNCFKIAISGFVLATLLAGCNLSKLRYENSFKLDPSNNSRTMTVDAPKNDQEVSIEVTAGETIKVEVSALDNGKSKLIKQRTDVKNFSDTVKIAAGQKFTIAVTLVGPKQTEVTVKAHSLD